LRQRQGGFLSVGTHINGLALGILAGPILNLNLLDAGFQWLSPQVDMQQSII
jgi:hypothetical protein